MEYILSTYSAVDWGLRTNRSRIPDAIIINKRKGNNWQMSFCHEIGHVLLNQYMRDVNIAVPRSTICSSLYIVYHVNRYTLIDEVLAWRLAKSYCKSKYWNEKVALESLGTYWTNGVFESNCGHKPPFPINIEPLTDINELKEIITW